MGRKNKNWKILNIDIDSQVVKEFKKFLSNKIIGQERVIEKLVDNFELWQSGFRNPSKPIFSALFLGPSGVGKTYIVETLSEYFFGSPTAFTKIACSELSESHKISLLLGAPPGYIGYQDEPLLSWWNIYKHDLIQKYKKYGFEKLNKEQRLHLLKEIENKLNKIKTELEKVKFNNNRNLEELRNLENQLKETKEKLDVLTLNTEGDFISIILFDEIEKADPVIYNLLLEIMDKGRLTLSNGFVVSLKNSFIFMTSNVGAKDIEFVFSEKQIGFKTISRSYQEVDRTIYEKAITAAKNIFSPEFRGRLDTIEVFRYLSKRDLMKILELQIKDFHTKLAKEFPIEIIIDKKAKELILQEATDKIEYGARLLKNKFYSIVVKKLAKLKNCGQIQIGDKIKVSVKNGKIIFYKLNK